MNRKIILSEGEFYHIYNRGNDKRNIFLDASDYRRFMELLFFCNGSLKVNIRELRKRLDKGDTLVSFLGDRGETIVDIGAYCLMPNHFHLLLHEKVRNGITMFLKKLCTGYSMYFNIKNNRTGKLFEGTFHARHADSDDYLKYLFSYIHLNPVKIVDPNWKEDGLSKVDGHRDFIENYKFSSYKDYLNDHVEGNLILNKQAFPAYFADRSIRNETEEWLNFQSIS